MLHKINNYEDFLDRWLTAEQEFEEFCEDDALNYVMEFVKDSADDLCNCEPVSVHEDLITLCIDKIHEAYEDSKQTAIANFKRRAWEYETNAGEKLQSCIAYLKEHQQKKVEND